MYDVKKEDLLAVIGRAIAIYESDDVQWTRGMETEDRDGVVAYDLTRCVSKAVGDVFDNRKLSTPFLIYVDDYVVDNYSDTYEKEQWIRPVASFNDSFPCVEYSKKGKDMALSFLVRLYTYVKEREKGEMVCLVDPYRDRKRFSTDPLKQEVP